LRSAAFSARFATGKMKHEIPRCSGPVVVLS
jgi:hypothetical protein